MAQAEADAAVIKAQSDIDVAYLKGRTSARLLQEEMKNQENIESIADKASPQLMENADAGNVDNDWMKNFFNHCRNISNDEMQSLWAKILAGEVNKPGTFRRRTVSFLADFDKSEVEQFTSLCSFAAYGYQFPLVYDHKAEIYTSNGVHYASLSHLDTIGLINFNAITGFSSFTKDNPFRLDYFGKVFIVDNPDAAFKLGSVTLTALGRELAPLSNAKEVPGFVAYLESHWKTQLLNIAWPVPP